MARFNNLKDLDKAVATAIKEGAWPQVAALAAELQQAVAAHAPSQAEGNWQAPAQPLGLSATLPEKRLGWAVAEGFTLDGQAGWWADLPLAQGLLGDKQERSLDLADFDGLALTFYAVRLNPSGEDICKGLRDLVVASALYRAFCAAPRQFGYNTQKSPLPQDGPELRWQLLAPKDLLNPRKQELRWGEKDVWGMQALMKGLGVAGFSIARLQAEAEALRAAISKDNFSPGRARQWFENREAVALA
jgi:hypothetical protein